MKRVPVFPRNGYAMVHDAELAERYEQKAFAWCDENSFHHDPEIWLDLSAMYAAKIPDAVDEEETWGEYDARTRERAIYWLRKAASQGLAKAQYELGQRYVVGKGVSQDDKQAVYWFRKSAEQGYADAQIILGWCYADGDGAPKNEAIAVEWFQKAAEQGSAWGQCSLGGMYKEGTGVKQDNEQAIHWYRKAAEQGDDFAQMFLKELGIDWKTP